MALKIKVEKTGVNFGYIGLVKNGRHVKHETVVVGTPERAREMAESWLRKSSAAQ